MTVSKRKVGKKKQLSAKQLERLASQLLWAGAVVLPRDAQLGAAVIVWSDATHYSLTTDPLLPKAGLRDVLVNIVLHLDNAGATG